MSNNPAFNSIKNIVTEIYSKTTSDSFSQETLDSYKNNVAETINKLSDLQGQFIENGDNMGAYLSGVTSLALSSSVEVVTSTSKVSTGQINIEQQASLFMNNIQKGLSRLTLSSAMDSPETSDLKQFMADAQSFYDQKTPENFNRIKGKIDEAVKSVMTGDQIYPATEDLMVSVEKYGKEFCNAVYSPRVQNGTKEYKAPQQDNKKELGFDRADMARIKSEFEKHARDKNWGTLG